MVYLIRFITGHAWRCTVPNAADDLLLPTDRKVAQNRLAFRSHCESSWCARLDPIINSPGRKDIAASKNNTVMAPAFGALVNDDTDF
jgi:hypothetical protein